MTVMVWYDNGMKRRNLLPAAVLMGGFMLGVLFFGGGSAYAQSGGGIGSGGTGGSSGTAGNNPHSSNGWGWRIYSVADPVGPTLGFKSGDWATVQATCTGYSSSVAIFVIDNDTHQQMGYDYHLVYYGPPIFSAYKSTSPYITVPAAQAAYDALTVDKTGYTWGVNVGWFCYGALPVDVCPNLAGNQATIPSGYVKDGVGNCVIPDVAATITVDTLNCTTNTVSGVALDADWSGEIDVHIYVGGVAGSGAPRYVRRTASHRFTFNDPNPDPMRRGGQNYYVYAIGVNSSGAASGNNVAFAGNPARMGPCNAAHCVVPSNFPDVMTVGQTYYLKPQIRLDYAWGSPYSTTTGPAPTLYDPTMHVTIVNDTTGAVVYDQDVKYDAGFPTPGTTLTANPTGVSGDVGIPFTPNTAGRYGLAWSLRGALTVNCNGGGAGDGHEEHGNAGFSPFFAVTGGDILAIGDIRSWNDDGVAGSYAGGGVQLAALATGSVQNFITGSGLPSGYFASGHGLGFANTGAGGTTYGGGYTVTAFVPEVPAQTATLSGAVDLSSLTDGVYYAGGDITLYGQLPTASQVTIVVATGNSVYVSGNITYGAYGANTDDIPRLTVIVQNGNISVDRTVSQMRGIFIVQGTGANGNFQTCASAMNAAITSITPNAYALCNSRLTLYGAVAANKLVLGRTSGTYRVNGAGVPILPAEEFYYSPELWLAPDGTNSTSNGRSRYDSFVSLPPVL